MHAIDKRTREAKCTTKQCYDWSLTVWVERKQKLHSPLHCRYLRTNLTKRISPYSKRPLLRPRHTTVHSHSVRPDEAIPALTSSCCSQRLGAYCNWRNPSWSRPRGAHRIASISQQTECSSHPLQQPPEEQITRKTWFPHPPQSLRPWMATPNASPQSRGEINVLEMRRRYEEIKKLRRSEKAPTNSAKARWGERERARKMRSCSKVSARAQVSIEVLWWRGYGTGDPNQRTRCEMVWWPVRSGLVPCHNCGGCGPWRLPCGILGNSAPRFDSIYSLSLRWGASEWSPCASREPLFHPSPSMIHSNLAHSNTCTCLADFSCYTLLRN